MAADNQGSAFDRLRLYWSLVRYSSAHNRDFAREHHEFFTEMNERLSAHIGNLRNKRVLDVGCGKAAWLSLLLHSHSAQVTGIDTEFAKPGASLRKYAALLRHNGPDRALRTFGWDILYARPYYRALAALCPIPLRFADLDLRPMNIAKLDFPDGTFDLVVSHEVFEHLPDIPGAVHELRRVMKPGALTYIYIHNFASLSGGHHIEWKYPDTAPSTIVPPWDHLRESRYPDIPSWINRLREQQFREAFEAEFEIQQWLPRGEEGRGLLTDQIRRELSSFTDEELLTKGFVVMATPRT